MTNRILILLFSFAATIVLGSCHKKEKFPVEPHIEYVSFTKVQNGAGIDDIGILKISFTDGDGDIGLNQEDTLPPFNTASVYHDNLFITYYEKQHGVFTVIDLPGSYNARIPSITPDDEDKSLEGDIDIELIINNPFSTFDTITFDIYLVDRALHLSNTISTPEIIVKKH